jgi:O-antigen ligase
MAALAFATWRSANRLRYAALLGFLLIPIVLITPLTPFQRLLHPNFSDREATQERIVAWKAGLKMIENHPVLGVGYFNFPEVYAAYSENTLWHGTAQLPHNIFIQVGTDAGLIGLGIFVMLIYRNLKGTRDIRRACEGNPEAPAFAASVARGLALTTCGFVIAGQFNTVGYYPFLWINLALTVSLANIVRRAGQGPASTGVAPLAAQNR